MTTSPGPPRKSTNQAGVCRDAYGDIDRGKLILRDMLAIDRTFLANQNTFLAYIRTALTLFVAGVTFIRFFESIVIEVIGWVFIPIGVVTFFVGLVRYNVLRVALDKVKQPRHTDEGRSPQAPESDEA